MKTSSSVSDFPDSDLFTMVQLLPELGIHQNNLSFIGSLLILFHTQTLYIIKHIECQRLPLELIKLYRRLWQICFLWSRKQLNIRSQRNHGHSQMCILNLLFTDYFLLFFYMAFDFLQQRTTAYFLLNLSVVFHMFLTYGQVLVQAACESVVTGLFEVQVDWL